MEKGVEQHHEAGASGVDDTGAREDRELFGRSPERLDRRRSGTLGDGDQVRRRRVREHCGRPLGGCGRHGEDRSLDWLHHAGSGSRAGFSQPRNKIGRADRLSRGVLRAGEGHRQPAEDLAQDDP